MSRSQHIQTQGNTIWIRRGPVIFFTCSCVGAGVHDTVLFYKCPAAKFYKVLL